MADNVLEVVIEGTDQSVPLSSFLKVVENAFSLLKGVDSALGGGGGQRTKWDLVGASMHSPCTVAISAAPLAQGRVEAGIAGCVAGLRRLDAEAHMPQYFDDAMLEHAKKIVSTLADGVSLIRFSAGGLTAIPTQRVAANVDRLTRRSKQEGMLEGCLQRVDAHGDLRFRIFDVVTGEGVPCDFGDALREKVRSSLYERVKVTGTIHYSREGKPVRVEVKDVTPFPKNPPGFFRIPPIDITGGVDAADYIERLREDG